MMETLPKPIAIVGLGVTGQSVLEMLRATGTSSSHVMTFDENSSQADYSDAGDLLNNGKPKTLVVSPGVPLKKDWIQRFSASGGVVTSELAIAFSFLTTEKLICVTGSVGKSTTVALLQEGLKSFCTNYFVGGNLGTPLAKYICDVATDSRARAEWIVLELSSFQLENFKNLSADFCAITSLLPNHLERYSSKTEYYKTKWTLIDKTKRLCVLNTNGGELKDYASNNRNLNKCQFVSPNSPELANFNISETRLIGSHNIDNLAVASMLALSAGWPEACIAAMKNFAGLEHRLENCGTIAGRSFINDSKSTTVDSVLQAVRAVTEIHKKGKIILLVGGKDKNLPWRNLASLASNPDLRFCFFGEVGAKAQSLSALPGKVYPNLKLVMADLPKVSSPGDTILFSPGGSSYDEFKNFEERGNYFKAEIAKY